MVKMKMIKLDTVDIPENSSLLDLFDEKRIKHMAAEYTIDDRDEQNGEKLTLLEQTKISFDKYVTRVGYKIHSKSFTKKQWFEMGVKLLAEETNSNMEQIRFILTKLDLLSPFKAPRWKHKIYDALVNETIGKKKKEFFNKKEYPKPPFPFDENWQDIQKEFDMIYSYRRMWFIDSQHTGKIIGKVQRKTGLYYPPHEIGGSDYYEEPPEWIPGGLHPMYNQNLYEIKSDRTGFTYLVYPEDVEVIHET
jgi:hypothetical protein